MFCPACGNDSPAKSNTCHSCGVDIRSNDIPAEQSHIVRPLNLRMIGGVCSGLAIHFGWDVAMVRMAFATAACVTTGAIIPFYLVAWKSLPNACFALPPATRIVHATT